MTPSLACLFAQRFQYKLLVDPFARRLRFWQKPAQFLNRPNMIADSTLHRRGNAESLMDAAEVVIHKPNRHGSRMVLNLFRERVGKASEAANAHSHAEVLTFNEAGADVL